MLGEMNFPLKNGNRDQSFNNSGIQYFKGAKALAYVVRETIQNIIDAGNSPNQVKAVFNVVNIPKEKIPGHKELEYAMEACKEYTLDSKAENFFDNAFKILQNNEIPSLVVSDYNTTGLTGVSKEGKEDTRGTRWHKLVLSEGSSLKDEGSGGSFGIGKKAPFALSRLRTVFYGTKTINNEEGFKGISELVTHPDKNEDLRFGTGFFGIKENDETRAILDLSKVDDFFKRNKPGTDIYIPGFKETPDWDIQIIEYVLDNFLVAIKENNLVVEVKDKVISSETLDDCFENYNPSSNSVHFYNALTSSDNRYFSEENFLEEYGEVELYLLSRDSEDVTMPNRVALTRKTGMRIKNKKNFPRMYNFSGVFIAKSDKLNEFLRQMEPPRHDDWKPELYEEDPKKAEKVYKKIRRWINKKVHKLYEPQEKEEVEVEWMNEYFPMELNGNEDVDSKDRSENKNQIKEVEVIKKESTISKTGEGKTGEGKTGEGKTGEGKSKDNNLKILKSRILSQKNTRYEFLLEFNKNTKANIEFSIIGEIGKENLPIESAVLQDSGEELNLISVNKIGPVTCYKNNSQIIVLNLKENIKCAVEVSAVEI